MKRILTLSITLMAAAWLQAPVAAQSSEAPAEFGDKVDVNEVLLDVLVTDRNDNVIVGLDRDDFVVEEEGNEVTLSGSSFYSNRELVESAGAETSAPGPADVSEDRYFILFLHDQRVNVPRLTRKYLELARQSEDWIRTELLPNDWVAVVSYDFKLKVHSDFTRDNEQLVEAVYNAARGKNPPKAWPSRAQEAAPEQPSLLTNLPTGKELRRETTRIYSALEVLAEAAGDVVGRKNLLFFSAGFGDETGFGTFLPDPRFYDDTVESLNDNNVAVYSISVLTGVDFAGLTQARAQLAQNTMSVLSDDTGGNYYFNHVSFQSPLEQALAENSGYYLLSYRSETPAGESGYREVSVKAKNPDFKVKAREGYRFGARESG